MAYEVLFSPGAVRELKGLRAHVRAAVLDAIERHLVHQPTRTSRSRIKKLRGLRKPQYRLRVGETRVFYDVSGRVVEVLAIIGKEQVQKWLGTTGVVDEEGGAGSSEG